MAVEKLDRLAAIHSVAEVMNDAIIRALEECTRTCLNCEHFKWQGEQCGLNGMVPPPSIAARGCECHQDFVPF